MKGEENENIWYHMDPSNKEHGSVLTFVNSFLFILSLKPKGTPYSNKGFVCITKGKKDKNA
jgi:hypothetical protein